MPKSHTLQSRASARSTAAGLVIPLFLFLAWPPCPWRAHAGTRRPRPDRVESVLRAARSALGTPYRNGGTSPSTGFDCSGFTRWAWQHGGDNLPHSSSQQYEVVRRRVKRRQLQPGDLLFFYRPVSHVAIYVGRGRMIEAAHSGAGVRRAKIYWQYFTAAARPP